MWAPYYARVGQLSLVQAAQALDQARRVATTAVQTAQTPPQGARGPVTSDGIPTEPARHDPWAILHQIVVCSNPRGCSLFTNAPAIQPVPVATMPYGARARVAGLVTLNDLFVMGIDRSFPSRGSVVRRSDVQIAPSPFATPLAESRAARFRTAAERFQQSVVRGWYPSYW